MIPIILAVIVVIVGTAANVVGIRAMRNVPEMRLTTITTLVLIDVASCLSLVNLAVLLAR
ncbi:hypothetical protein [Actinomyces succiniciruminis]|uniref:G-protein coupled receptors family 1 profile domain-containing protein n=1 Tax=Actinomyces succiniciruminis TaxID=1522002 RepID=A0A1L7RRT1_9ACTO|nr:hypothetical protein [Actinomyces succiniciruminis]CED92442.1 Hypothetical protein AAM4_2610 [Actinomyces succiniciruminis]